MPPAPLPKPLPLPCPKTVKGEATNWSLTQNCKADDGMAATIHPAGNGKETSVGAVPLRQSLHATVNTVSPPGGPGGPPRP